MYKQFIIISNLGINDKLLENIDYLKIDKNFEFTSLYQLNVNNQIYDFDYLITDIKINNLLICEEDFIITNQYFESSIDNYFIIGKLNKSNITIDEQIKIIFDYINGNI